MCRGTVFAFSFRVRRCRLVGGELAGEGYHGRGLGYLSDDTGCGAVGVAVESGDALCGRAGVGWVARCQRAVTRRKRAARQVGPCELPPVSGRFLR